MAGGLPPGNWDQETDQCRVGGGLRPLTPGFPRGPVCAESTGTTAAFRGLSAAGGPPSAVKPAKDQAPPRVETKAGNAAVVVSQPVKVVAADSFFFFVHEIVHVRASNHLYGKVKGAPQYVNKYIQFGPAGSFLGSPLTAVQILAGIPVRGEVDISLSYNLPKWLEWLRFGYGYEGLLEQGTALQLDPAKGDKIVARAEEIQKQAQAGKYLYLVYDKMGPILGSTVMEAKARNCIGFVSDLLQGVE